MRLLDAAECLFVARGFEGTSLRAVTREAGVSVSAANYHFGSKEAMIAAALRRRIEPLNQRRLERLTELEAAAADGMLEVEAIVEAFLRPGFEEFQAYLPNSQSIYGKLAARLHSDPSAGVASLKFAIFKPVATRFLQALSRALPAQSEADLLVGFHFMLGMLVHTLIERAQLHSVEEPYASVHDSAAPREVRVPQQTDAPLQQMVRFAAAGLRSVGPAGCDGGAR